MSRPVQDTHQRYRERVNAALDRCLPASDTEPARLHEAMRYATLAGGKRVRPLLVYLTGELLGIDPARLDGPACAVELIHTYSLVHDDLPAMDDDDLRRGRATCHRKFDEATAILVGDALQVLAFRILASDPAMRLGPAERLAMIDLLATASGTGGMAGGQAIDLAAAGQAMTRDDIETMHRHKTGALISAAVSMAACTVPDLSARDREALDAYAADLGLAFQIQDDILDIEGDEAELGKKPGADVELGKPTYPSVCGLDAARTRATELHASAIAALSPFGRRSDGLRALADEMASRRH